MPQTEAIGGRDQVIVTSKRVFVYKTEKLADAAFPRMQRADPAAKRESGPSAVKAIMQTPRDKVVYV